jgi:hypothetical protein
VVGNPELTCLCFGLCQIVNALIEFRTSSTLPPWPESPPTRQLPVGQQIG